VHEIYGLIERVDAGVIELRSMVRRQGNRLDTLEAATQAIREDVDTLRADVTVTKEELGAVRRDVGALVVDVAQILRLLQPPENPT
jgi:archaellum component FlaC